MCLGAVFAITLSIFLVYMLISCFMTSVVSSLMNGK